MINMPRTDEDFSFFVYSDSINTETFDDAQNCESESADAFNMSDGATNMGDAGSAGVAAGEGGTSAGNGMSAGVGM